MIKQVEEFIQKKHLLHKDSRVLVACSGGLDSMTAVDILSRLKYPVGLAHCNFELRGEESNIEQEFTEQYAKKNHIPYFTINFNTRRFAENNKLSIQETARFLRYTWLEEIRSINGFTHLVTAHHRDDQAETILQHIIRGTGIQGLQGMPLTNGHIIRPLLPFSRKDIRNYATENRLQWMEDSSNAETKYDRNFIRKEIIPLLEKLNPSVSKSIASLGEKARESVFIQEEWISKILRKNVRKIKEAEILSIGFLQNHPAASTILYYWLKNVGFSTDQLPDILESIDSGSSGLEFFSATHRLVRDRKSFYLLPQLSDRQDRLIIPKLVDAIRLNKIEIKCSLLPINELNIKESPRFAYFDADKVEWPLLLRYWEEGDYFYPFGMGKRQHPEKVGKKKLSKYFKDEKFSVLQKENTVVMLSGEKVLWIVGHRIDDRFKVSDKTRNILKMTITDGFEKE